MMNERIRELAKQAGFQSYITTHEEDVAMFEKFAELIVRECIVTLHRRGVEGFGIVEERMLKQHFGVEE